MAEPQSDVYALLEAHFDDQPKLRHYKHLPHRTDELRTFSSATAPLVLTADDDTDSVFTDQQPTPLEPPAVLKGTDGLPPTPPTMSQDGQPAQNLETGPHADDVMNSLTSKKSTLSTPVNARSPPTPDPSPPRSGASHANLERPNLFAYPSSRAESFMTAREDPLSSEASEGRSVTPANERLSTVEEDRGLGLAFENEDNDITPTDSVRRIYPPQAEPDATAGAPQVKDDSMEEVVPDREWNTELMRNVTIRRKRKPSTSPRKDPVPAVGIGETASPSPSPRPRRASGLRERVEASHSPVTPSIENFAQSIGWPSEDRWATEEIAEERGREEQKRNSTSSVSSTVVEARIIITPPRRRQTLRHSGKNMAYRDEGSPTPSRNSRRQSSRQSSIPEDVPLHRLVHKRVSLADRTKRISAESDTLGSERSVSSPLSFRSRIIDSSAATLRHQESVRMVLQPAADILSRTNSVTRPYHAGEMFHKRIASAPEPARKSAMSSAPRHYSQLSPPNSPRRAEQVRFQTPDDEPMSSIRSPGPSFDSPRSVKRRQRSNVAETKQPIDVNKSLPAIPHNEQSDSAPRDAFLGASHPEEERRPPSALMERVRQLVAEREAADEAAIAAKSTKSPATPEQPAALSPPQEQTPSTGRGSLSPLGLSLSRERASTSPEVVIRPSLDRVSTEEMIRRSHEYRRPSEEHGRVSFDRSTIRTEEHAGARHLFASTTPFSQFSDTPIEVSEATAVSIFPHNNHSLLVVQQVSRGNSMLPESRQLEHGEYLSRHEFQEHRSTPTPPFVDASESHHDGAQHTPQPPTLNFEPSTPPMQIALPQPSAVDSPLKNPRAPPEPPVINFIPPTPMEELEKQLVPGPPKRSDSHPQRRLSLVQRARRYSDQLLPTLLNRAASNRGRYVSDSHRSHRNPKVPSVNEEDGTLHPFWRPRGFWDGFDDSESESSEEGLHPGGDTSDVEEEAQPPRRSNTLGKRLTSGFRGSGGFLIGNSLGVERHGTNKRRHHVTLPPHFPKSPKSSTHTSSPKIMIQPPTFHDSNNRVSKRTSHGSLRAAERRGSWRDGRSLPGLGKKYQVQYIGLSGVKERFREGRREKRRDKIRQSIGTRVYDEHGGPNAT
ncbi:hypothetical protein EK21DRAFT_60072 [Setomelanomma holmii]|uniref:Uncharacterized protein n=1 Tax=Setomelanomma holmii TaxID=210430 RepID=A0A9P4LP70_9PLEO|nr:hypothetical protein EK21DRAFT_60072 [Setomelanomma holmii]